MYVLGFLALLLSLALFAACISFKVDVSSVYDSFIGIITATFCLSVVIAVIVYVMACVQKTGLSPGGNTGTDYRLNTYRCETDISYEICLMWPELKVSMSLSISTP